MGRVGNLCYFFFHPTGSVGGDHGVQRAVFITSPSEVLHQYSGHGVHAIYVYTMAFNIGESHHCRQSVRLDVSRSPFSLQLY